MRGITEIGIAMAPARANEKRPSDDSLRTQRRERSSADRQFRARNRRDSDLDRHRNYRIEHLLRGSNRESSKVLAVNHAGNRQHQISGPSTSGGNLEWGHVRRDAERLSSLENL